MIKIIIINTTKCLTGTFGLICHQCSFALNFGVFIEDLAAVWTKKPLWPRSPGLWMWKPWLSLVFICIQIVANSVCGLQIAFVFCVSKCCFQTVKYWKKIIFSIFLAPYTAIKQDQQEIIQIWDSSLDQGYNGPQGILSNACYFMGNQKYICFNGLGTSLGLALSVF